MALAESAALIRQSIDLAELPWTRPLALAYNQDYDRLSPFFAGNPAESSAWSAAIDRAQRAAHDRARIAAILDAQLASRGAPGEAVAQARRLADAGSVAVITGQQAGVFGGPLYTLFKAVTALKLAQKLSEDYGVAAVAMFWVESEDHDWAEVRTASVLDRQDTVQSITVPDLPGAGSQPVARLVLDERIGPTLDALASTLPQTEFTAELIDRLRRRYREGAGVSEAFAGWLEDLLGPSGLVVFDAADPAAKPLAAPLFVEELRHPGRAMSLVRDTGARLAALGYPPQLEHAADTLPLFYLDGEGRRALKWDGTRITAGSHSWPAEALAAEAEQHPERFSPNVVLRPIVQDRLFPTVCYVAGPNELAYLAQLGDVYRTLGVPMPLMAPRATATLLDGAAMKFLERAQVPLAALQPPDDTLINQLLQRALPPGLDAALETARQQASDETGRIRELVTGLDPTLTGAVDTTRERIEHALKTLQSKIIQAAKRKDETLRRQFTHARQLAFPDGHPQERTLNLTALLNRIGPALPARLLEALPAQSNHHFVMVI